MGESGKGIASREGNSTKLFLLTIKASYIYIEKFIFILVTKKGV